MRSLDVMTDPNKLITKKTWVGGVLSLMCFVFLIILLRSEYTNWSEKRITKTIYVDNINQPKSITVTLSILLPNCPCSILSLDVHDMLESHQEDIPVDKYRINKKGERLEKV